MLVQADMSDSTDHGKLMQLLPNFDVWVNKMNLQIVINEAPSRKDGAALFVLRRIIPLVFAWEELACSRGQGLNCKTTDDMFGKVPLDPTKVAACKGFSFFVYFRRRRNAYTLPLPAFHYAMFSCCCQHPSCLSWPNDSTLQ